MASHQPSALQEARDHINAMKGYTRLFLILMSAFWASALFVIAVGSESFAMIGFFVVAGSISLIYAYRSWSERVRVETRLKRFGYDPENEVK